MSRVGPGAHALHARSDPHMLCRLGSTVLLFPGHFFVRNVLTLQDAGTRAMRSSELTLASLWF